MLTSLTRVALDPDTARRLANAGRKVETWREERDRLIVAASEQGGTLREIADLVGLSNPGVLNIIRKAPMPKGILGDQEPGQPDIAWPVGFEAEVKSQDRQDR